MPPITPECLPRRRGPAAAAAAVATLCLASVALPAIAQTKLQPGLWEMASQFKTQSGQMEAAMAEMQKSLAAMPPEQRRQMEQMLAQQGVVMGQGGGGTQTVRICLSERDAALDQVPQREGCTQNLTRTGPSSLRMSFQCQKPEPMSGEGTITMDGPKAYTGSYRMKSTVQGKAETMEMTQKARWVSADCGTLKPIQR
ncbi:DUF3617 domain-containing protein [Acidovorax lacteus]|uniref:DUF3617 domain-containing protein n=1 Tax=Acidovorax lacteus TaxID=1924988 RepID=A0ABP8LCI8_9BURK